jgi:hypothetical protein
VTAALLPSSLIDMAVVRVVALVAALSGCSTLMPRRGYVPPLVDSVVATSGAILIASSQRDDDDEMSGRSAIVLGTAVLIAFGISALHGFDHATEPPVTQDEP